MERKLALHPGPISLSLSWLSARRRCQLAQIIDVVLQRGVGTAVVRHRRTNCRTELEDQCDADRMQPEVGTDYTTTRPRR